MQFFKKIGAIVQKALSEKGIQHARPTFDSVPKEFDDFLKEVAEWKVLISFFLKIP